MRDLAVALIVFGSLPVILFRPFFGILVWSWLAYMVPHRLAYGWAYDFPFAQIVAVTFLIGLILSSESKRLPWTRLVLIWIGFVAWQCVTTYYAMLPDAALEALKTSLKSQLLLFCALMIVRSRERIDAIVWIIVVSLAFFGVKGGIYTLMTGGSNVLFGPGGVIADNNQFGLALVMVIPLMRYLQQRIEKSWGRSLLTLSMVCTAIAVVGTYSRGALLAAAAMIVFLVLRGRKRAMLAVFLIALVPIAANMMPSEWAQRMGTIRSYEEDRSATGRINGYLFAINLAKDHPLVGKGFGPSTQEMYDEYAPDPTYKVEDVHSIFLEVLVEHGFVGLGLFLFLGVSAFRTSSWIIRRADELDQRWAGDLSRMLQASLIGYVVGGAFHPMAYFDLAYNLIALVVLTRCVLEGMARAHSLAPRTQLASGGALRNPGSSLNRKLSRT